MKSARFPLVPFLFALLAALVWPAAAQDSGTRIRVGDMFDLSIGGVPGEEVAMISKTYTVGEDGTINLSYIGRVSVAGLTVTEAQQRIEAAYRAGQIFTNPAITINMSALRFVNVEGAVRAPQRVPYTPDLTLMGVIAACGGFNEFANQKEITLSRDGRTMKFNARELRRNPALDPKLQPGDKVSVPQSWW